MSCDNCNTSDFTMSMLAIRHVQPPINWLYKRLQHCFVCPNCVKRISVLVSCSHVTRTYVLFYAMCSLLLKFYTLLVLMSRTLIVPDSNFAHAEEVA